jgi:tetratricopeptide (TPR) repeat protein
VDDFSDLDDLHPRQAKRHRLMYIVVGGVVAVSVAAYLLLGVIYPYAKGGDSEKQERPAGWSEQLSQRVQQEDPALRGEAMRSPRRRAASRLRPRAARNARAASQPMEAMEAREAREPPGAMAPEARRAVPPSGVAEAAALAAEAKKSLANSAAKAAALAEKALKLHPAQPLARKVLAQVLEGKAKTRLYAGQYGPAVKAAQRAIELDPTRTDPWLYLGVARNEQGKKTEAKGALQEYLRRCPKCRHARTAKSILRTIP